MSTVIVNKKERKKERQVLIRKSLFDILPQGLWKHVVKEKL
jgi:hypothetical protein